jgi:hypothetical protein
MTLKDKLYVGGALLTSLLTFQACNSDENAERKSTSRNSYGIDSKKPSYNLDFITMNDAHNAYSISILSNIQEKASKLNSYRKENVTDPSDNNQWVNYVNLEDSVRREYGQLPLRCAVAWHDISTKQNISPALKKSKLSEYVGLVDNTSKALDTIRSIKTDPLLQIIDNYNSFSIPVYDSTSKHVFSYRIICGEGGENETQLDGVGTTKAERKVRLLKVDLGSNPADIIEAERTMSGNVVNKMDVYMDFAKDDFTYGYIMDLLDGKK